MQQTATTAYSPDGLKSMIERGEALLIDVRDPAENAREAIRGSKLMPLATLKPGDVPAAHGKSVVFYCASGIRSEKAARLLRDAGYSGHVGHLAGGLAAWKRAGLQTDFNPRAPLPIIRQVQIVAGSLILFGIVLGYAVAPAWFLLAGVVGAGLLFAGLTGWCGMATLLGWLPYNRA